MSTKPCLVLSITHSVAMYMYMMYVNIRFNIQRQSRSVSRSTASSCSYNLWVLLFGNRQSGFLTPSVAWPNTFYLSLNIRLIFYTPVRAKPHLTSVTATLPWSYRKSMSPSECSSRVCHTESQTYPASRTSPREPEESTSQSLHAWHRPDNP